MARTTTVGFTSCECEEPLCEIQTSLRSTVTSLSKILLLGLHVGNLCRSEPTPHYNASVSMTENQGNTSWGETHLLQHQSLTVHCGTRRDPTTSIYIRGGTIKDQQWVFLESRSIGTTLSRSTDTAFSFKKLKMKMLVSLLHIVYSLRGICTWNLRMSRGLPAFFKQFWLHLRKNFRKNL